MKKLLAAAGTSLILFMMLWVPVYAADLDEITGNMLLETSAQTEVREAAADDAKVVTSLESGTVVFTLDKAENSWCRISAGEYTGYVKVEHLKTIGDRDLISQELQQDIDNNHMIYDEAQQLEEQKNRERMVGKITLVLIAAIFVAGGVFTMIRTKGNTQEEIEK